MEEDKEILQEILNEPRYYFNYNLSFEAIQIRAKAIENILNRLEQQNNNINNTIKAIEILRQDFSEDLQVEFINLLNTLTGGEYLK